MEKYTSKFCKSKQYQVLPYWERQEEPNNYVELPAEEIPQEFSIVGGAEYICNLLSPPVKEIKNKNVIVIIDCGHGKSTCGKKSPYSMNKVLPELPFEEWKWNRIIGKLLFEKFKGEGIEVRYTVDPSDYTDPQLTTRANIANKIQKENSDKKTLFISIHSNACGCGDKWMNARGWSVYTTEGKTNSDILAECLYDGAEKILKPNDIKIRYDYSDGDRDYEKNFTVIYKANMPAVLIENLFYDNIDDVKILNSEEGQNLIADTIVDGTLSFIKKKWNI